MKLPKWLIGIDEAGRGPLAGPVAVGLVKIPHDFDWASIPGVGDSKVVSPKNRRAIFGRAKQLRKEGKLDFVVMLGSASAIDKQGIAVVIRELIETGLKKITVEPISCFVKLDGSLRAPESYHQETIIRGDSKELVIGLASIIAKETRDCTMDKLAKKYPLYQFETHKGYGTKKHRRLIYKHELSAIHRVTYCKNYRLWGKV